MERARVVANAATGCMNVTTGKRAINNCKLVVNNRHEAKLVCKQRNIPPHTELAWNYDNDYIFPHP